MRCCTIIDYLPLSRDLGHQSDWEASSSEEEEKPAPAPVAPPKKKGTLKAKLAEKEALKAAKAARRLRAFWRAERPDVLQTYFLDSTYFGAPLARLAGVPKVVRVRNNTPAGPFGGSAAFTQTAAARKRAIAYRLKKRAEEAAARK